jgi:hypothetical protein
MITPQHTQLVTLLMYVAAVRREVGLLKINVERAESDVLAGIKEQDWPKVDL